MADGRPAPSGARLWELIHERRGQVADMLGTLSDEEWNRPSLCTAWRVRDVAAHCVETHLMTPPRFIGQFAGSGFRFHSMTAKAVRNRETQPVAALLDDYRRTMSRTTAPPGPAVAMLAEAVIHGEDMARPAGRALSSSPDVLIAAAEFTRKAQPLLHGRTRSAGLRLQATDVDWSAGEGPEVSGPLASIIIAIAGRPSGLAGLSGAGLETLSSRVTAAAS